jgi:hypothetical protein
LTLILSATAPLSLQIAKDAGAFQPYTRAFRFGFLPDAIFKSFSFPDGKKITPLNVVSAHTDNIPHIENFFIKPVQRPTDPLRSVGGINQHGMVIANFAWSSTETLEHPQGHFIYNLVFQSRKILCNQ